MLARTLVLSIAAHGAAIFLWTPVKPAPPKPKPLLRVHVAPAGDIARAPVSFAPSSAPVPDKVTPATAEATRAAPPSIVAATGSAIPAFARITPPVASVAIEVDPAEAAAEAIIAATPHDAPVVNQNVPGIGLPGTVSTFGARRLFGSSPPRVTHADPRAALAMQAEARASLVARQLADEQLARHAAAAGEDPSVAPPKADACDEATGIVPAPPCVREWSAETLSER